MPTSGSRTRPDGDGSIAVILRMLARQLPGGVALLISRNGDMATIEEAYPPVQIAGRSIPLPAGLPDGKAGEIDAADKRVSLGWTEVCGSRPTHFAIAPVAQQSLHLLLVSCGKGLSELTDLVALADLIDRLPEIGIGTRRRRDASLRIGALIDNLPIPVLFVDSRTVEVFLNDRARILLDIDVATTSEQTVAGALAKLIAGAGEGRRVRLATDPTANLSFEIEHRGRGFAVESRWVAEERLTGRLWLFREVTEERQVARLKDELVSTVSHELRTPLTSVLGSLSLLKDGHAGTLPERAAGLIDIAFRNGTRLIRLVNDLLDLDKLQAGALDFRFRTVDVRRLIDEAVDQNRPYADGYGITLASEGAPEPVPATIDPDRIAQVLNNLISNAVKFSPAGGLVRVRLKTGVDTIRISVIDLGTGISAAFREHLFSRFAQEGQVSRVGEASTGLGLAISKAIVDQHGGTIAADPDVAIGATFHVDLPIDGPPQKQ